jgi:hypothetical protein
VIYLAGCVNWEQQSEFHHVQTQIEQPSYVCDTFFNTRASPLKFVNGGRCPPPLALLFFVLVSTNLKRFSLVKVARIQTQ